MVGNGGENAGHLHFQVVKTLDCEVKGSSSCVVHRLQIYTINFLECIICDLSREKGPYWSS